MNWLIAALILSAPDPFETPVSEITHAMRHHPMTLAGKTLGPNKYVSNVTLPNARCTISKSEIGFFFYCQWILSDQNILRARYENLYNLLQPLFPKAVEKVGARGSQRLVFYSRFETEMELEFGKIQDGPYYVELSLDNYGGH